MRELVRLTCGCLLVGLPSAWCWADGGVVRAIERDGPLVISAFTAPNPLVAGPVDTSVLVQDAVTLAPVQDVQIEVAFTPRSRMNRAVTLAATSEAATNKLFRACLVELEPGWYDVEVICDAAGKRGSIRFALEVGAAPAPLAVLWPWFTWPVLPVVLFGLHLLLSRKRGS
ncbi:MAG: hypothetical protein WD063_07810 [Pirellulales bacterium]